MLSKTEPPRIPVNRRQQLKGAVAALPMLVAEEAAFFDKQTLAMKKLKQRQATVNLAIGQGTST